ncbi:hypothetical protein [Acutalibacter sp. 1XD8-36]|uniref:hypothetical protein n=1 Tax=Acutalibacter sp. 1XD8-36 TaxID=2320852 RepID=UPI00261370D3|nr:hypothetical protein [Acutalibacter sp. 1XD8-36]
MKKTVSILAALILMVSLAISAHAAEQDFPKDSEDVKERVTLRVHEYMFSDMTKAKARALSDEDFIAMSSRVDDIVREEHINAGWTEVKTKPHTAQEARKVAGQEVDPRAISLAYMDIEQAPEELKVYILSARREIIYRFEWLGNADKTSMPYGSEDDEDTKTFEISPRFSDLFPGWYEPQVDLVLPDWKNAPESGSGIYEAVLSASIGCSMPYNILYAAA